DVLRPVRVPVAVDELNLPPERVGLHVERVRMRTHPRREAAAREVRDLHRLAAQAVVDLAAQLVADEEVDDDGGEDDRDRHGGGGPERETRAEAHRPTPSLRLTARAGRTPPRAALSLPRPPGRRLRSCRVP